MVSKRIKPKGRVAGATEHDWASRRRRVTIVLSWMQLKILIRDGNYIDQKSETSSWYKIGTPLSIHIVPLLFVRVV
jgi:hypothetical protein